jgi:NCAIR mutase (PurE)-related protein
VDAERIRRLLEQVASGEVDAADAYRTLEHLPFAETAGGTARIDHHREIRTGQPEVVFCEGKSPQQVKAIARALLDMGDVMLGTRASAAQFQVVAQVALDARYFEDARILLVDRREVRPAEGHVVVVTAGTADTPVAEEAAISAEVFGNRVTRLFDVGVAGLHRVLAHEDLLRDARAIIAVAGMEGALPSVVAGLVACPVIAVPTSIGYGASFGGIAALLTMLNSCPGGIGVVNIDNGFGAAALATRINRGVPLPPPGAGVGAARGAGTGGRAQPGGGASGGSGAASAPDPSGDAS